MRGDQKWGQQHLEYKYYINNFLKMLPSLSCFAHGIIFQSKKEVTKARDFYTTNSLLDELCSGMSQ